MKTLFQALAAAVILSVVPAYSVEPTESKTITLQAPVDGVAVYSPVQSLQEGDRLEIVSAVQTRSEGNIAMDITFPGGAMQSHYLLGGATVKKVVLVGPLTFRLATDVGKVFVTFDIRRAGAPSNAVPIPQEAGSNFNVILEQSSDLLNWTPANPGSYTGTEPKRFFRTRIVKLP